MRPPPPQLRRWLPPAALALVVAALVPAYLSLPDFPRQLLFLSIGLVPMAAIAIGCHRYRIPERRPWIVCMVGLAMVNVGNVAGVYRAYAGIAENSAVENFSLAAGYLLLLSAAVLVALKHVYGNDAGLVHAALVGVAVAGPLWEFVLRPRLQSQGVATTEQVFALVDGLLLLTAIGPLLRASRTTVKARLGLTYLALSLLFPLIGTVVMIMFPAHYAVWPCPFWSAGSLCLAAAALHPSVANITCPEPRTAVRRAPIKLRYIGAILAINPVVGIVPKLWGGNADELLLSLGTLLMIVLVLMRFGQLLREREEAEAALAFQASHDEVTGLSNRRAMLTVLAGLLARQAGGDIDDLAILYCDLDGFKPVNDKLGHQAGDDVLRTVAERLRGTVRKQDAVGRIGGDEFLVLCPDLSRLDAAALERRIQEAVSTPMRVGGSDGVRVGVTIGTALAPRDARATADSLIAAADVAMYESKRLRSTGRFPVG